MLLSLLLAPQHARAEAPESYIEKIRSAPLVTEVDGPDAYRDLVFGTRCSTVAGFEVVHETPEAKVYRRPSDRLTIGAAPLTSIRYVCTDDALRFVLVTLPKDSLRSVANMMFMAYGRMSAQQLDLAYWRGAKRSAWLGHFDATGETYVMSVGDMPWADPLGLVRAVAETP